MRPGEVETKPMSKTKRFWRNNRFRMLLTLELAVMLPAAALIYFNYRHLENIQHEKVVEATIHRDFQEMLAISEKKINDKAYYLTEEAAKDFPSPDSDTDADKVKKLDLILENSPWFARVFIFDPKKGLLLRSQPEQMHNRDFREEHEGVYAMFSGWLGMESKSMCEDIHKKKRGVMWYDGQYRRGGSLLYMSTAFFVLPH